MKLFIKPLSILCLSLTLASCTGGSNEQAPEAGTEVTTEVAPEGAATSDMAPSCNAQSGSVCGADGKTYPSECEAQAGGVTSYESGVCAETK